MHFSDEFAEWLTLAFGDGFPDDILAFCFNLNDRGDAGLFSVELIGSDEFDAENDDWACSEIWSPAIRKIKIPLEFSGEDWRSCLEAITGLLKRILASKSNAAKILKSRRAIAVGFVDGDLDVILQS